MVSVYNNAVPRPNLCEGEILDLLFKRYTLMGRQGKAYGATHHQQSEEW